MGSIIYLKGSDSFTINLFNGNFDAGGTLNSGQLFYFAHTGSSTHSLNIVSSTFANVDSPNTSGCALYLIKTTVIDNGGSTYSNMRCNKGGVFYFEGSSI